MGKPKQYTKEEVLKAIAGCNTIISTVAKRLKCNWNTAEKYINMWEETKKAYENERQTIGDFAESKLIENVRKNDLGAIKYLLSKKYKDRGYGDETTQAVINQASDSASVIKIINDFNI